MNVDINTYLKLIFHTLVALLIVLSLPTCMFILLDIIIECSTWIVIVGSLIPCIVTIYWMLKYITLVVNKGWIFDI